MSLPGNPYCGQCGAKITIQCPCSCNSPCDFVYACECGWEGCRHDCHEFDRFSDFSVGIPAYLECAECGLSIDDDGRFDQEDI